MAPPGDDIDDFELIRRMAERDANPTLARQAWAVFYVRHRGCMLRVTGVAHTDLIGPDRVRDAVQDGFVKSFAGAKNFDRTECCEPIVQQRKVRAWLGRIIENVIRDSFRGQPQVTFVDSEDLEDLGGSVPDAIDQIGVPENERLRLLESGLSLLSDEEQAVLRATMFWWRSGVRQQRMPNSAMQRLAVQLGTTSDNVRQIRSRAMKKLKNHVNEGIGT
jgi:RNA polymerase sigma factor (sigma-70 family)